MIYPHNSIKITIETIVETIDERFDNIRETQKRTIFQALVLDEPNRLKLAMKHATEALIGVNKVRK
jgi:hypothetical protein